LYENHSLDQVDGNSQAPYLNTLTSQCGQARNLSDLDHPSAPNYIGLTSGALNAGAGDCDPNQCPDGDVSIFEQAGSWKSYSEGEPTNCDLGFDGDAYDVNHNPPAYYTRIRTACQQLAVPLGTFTSGPLVTDLAGNTLPKFAFIDPNTNDDMHDGTIAQGDTYLKGLMNLILNSTAYKSGNTAVVVTFDEGETTELVDTVLVAPSVHPGTKSTAAFTHYSTLRTTEEMLGLPLLQNAGNAASMRSAFNL